MAVDEEEAEAGPGQGVANIRAHPMEGYAMAVTDSLKNQSKKSMEMGNDPGRAQEYEDIVEDLRRTIPSMERRRRVDGMFLGDATFQYDRLMKEVETLRERKGTQDDSIKLPKPPTVDKKGKRPRYQEMFQWLDMIDPGDWGLDQDNEDEASVYDMACRIRASLKKQLTVDLLDDTRALRYRAYESKATEGEDRDGLDQWSREE